MRLFTQLVQVFLEKKNNKKTGEHLLFSCSRQDESCDLILIFIRYN